MDDVITESQRRALVENLTPTNGDPIALANDLDGEYRYLGRQRGHIRVEKAVVPQVWIELLCARMEALGWASTRREFAFGLVLGIAFERMP